MRSQRSSRRDFWFIIAASVSWGTVGVSTQAMYAHSATNALSLAFLRLAIAALLFLIASWLLLGRNLLQIKGRDLLIMLLMGGMQALYQASYNAAIAYTGVIVSTLIALCVAPVFVALCSTLMAREHLSLKTLIALMCALSGTSLLVVARSHLAIGGISFLGLAFALLAAGGYAIFILFGRLLANHYHPLHVNFVAFGAGALLSLSFASSARLVLVYPAWGWLLLLYLGCVPTAIAYSLFQTGMRSLSATVVSIMTLCEPLTAALLAWFFFHEDPGLLGLLGAVLSLGAMLLLAS
jgi:drug/metabolite transporter, DME family